jgi:TPR repeat protein
MVLTMEKSWYRKMFPPPPVPQPETLRTDASNDNADVQYGLGVKFANGKGADQDYAQAAEWYRKAAEQSHPLAQFNLGVMYAHGQGVARDDAQSADWFDKAAQQGDAGAQYHLGKSCHRASLRVTENAPECRIEAYKWYQLAAAQGYQGSHAACAAVILHMTREDVAAGDARVAGFTPTKTVTSTQVPPAAQINP